MGRISKVWSNVGAWEEYTPFYKKLYEDSENLGKALPEPRIKETKKVAEIYHYLEWGSESSGEWVADSLFDLDADIVIEDVSSCNTRKVQLKKLVITWCF